MSDQRNEEAIKPVATGSRKEPGLDRKLKDVFISDSAGSVGDFIVWDVIVPSIKGMLQQAGHGLVDGIFGSGGRYRGGSRYSYRDYDEPSYRSGRRSYATRRDDRRDDYDDRYDRRSRRRRSADSEVVLRSWAEAEDVRDGLLDIIDKYGVASVSHLNSLTNQSDRDYTDVNWGWDDISGSRIRTIRNYYPDGDGYVLELPTPIYIKDDRR